MFSETLRKTREYEQTFGECIDREERPSFHLTPYVGWMNDPNGLSYYNGQYHMFYQYHPYSLQWGPMHWGHVVSRDLLHWEYLPAALAPDTPADFAGCFSGSAIALPDGRHLLMYTGVSRVKDADGQERDVQNQCVAVGDGLNYEKCAENPVIDGKDLPKGFSQADFRDPKLWQGEDGNFYCVVGNRPADGNGQILLFKSPDGFHWEYDRVLIHNKGHFGKMWECPDLFRLDGKWVLLTSPQEMLPVELEYHNGNNTLCLIGEIRDGEFFPEHDQSIDSGLDFYAPQTLLAPDGRRIMIGWMQNWDAPLCGPEQKWMGQMTLPRELSIRNGRLYQQPIRELAMLRKKPVEYRNVTVDGVVTLPDIEGRQVELELTIRPAAPDKLYHSFAVQFAQRDGCYTQLTFRPWENTLESDRSFSGTRRAMLHQRRCKVNGDNGTLKLHLILDRFSAEAFINDGEQTMTTTFVTPQDAQGIRFLCDGAALLDVVKYDLSE